MNQALASRLSLAQLNGNPGKQKPDAGIVRLNLDCLIRMFASLLTGVTHHVSLDKLLINQLPVQLGKPFVCTARGSDINLYQQFATPRRLIERTLRQSAANIGVSADLVRQLVALGADPSKCHTIRNGVDLERFVPLDRVESRAALGLPAQGRLLLMVGHLVELKGHHLVIELLRDLTDTHLVIVEVFGVHDCWKFTS